MAEQIEVAPLRLNTAIKGLIIIYGLTIITNYIINAWMKAAPIGPWAGADILKWYWFDNVCYMLFSLWWCFFFFAVGMWPFDKIPNAFTRGLVATIVCWILGWFSYKAVYWLGLDAGWVFPIVGSLYFILVFFAYTGENWLVAGFPAPRQFGILLLICVALTWLLTMTYVRWVPPWWFPFCQMGLATGLFGYLFRKMRQPTKGIAMWLLMFLAVAVWLMISARLEIWDYKLEGIGKFWNIGSYDASNVWLLLFFVSCSFIYGVLVPLHNWPFSKIAMPGRPSCQRVHRSAVYHLNRCNQGPGRSRVRRYEFGLDLRVHGGGLVLFHAALFRYRLRKTVSVGGTENPRDLGRRGLKAVTSGPDLRRKTGKKAA